MCDAASSVTTSMSTSASASADAGTHNEADVAFAQGMIPHHEQAIEMSDMLLGKQGVDPAVVSLADKIKGAGARDRDDAGLAAAVGRPGCIGDQRR